MRLSFPAPVAAGRGDFTRAHQVTNVLLQELVVVVQLVVLLLDRFYTIKDHQKRIL